MIKFIEQLGGKQQLRCGVSGDFREKRTADSCHPIMSAYGP
jgi:hypothetical protein